MVPVGPALDGQLGVPDELNRSKMTCKVKTLRSFPSIVLLALPTLLCLSTLGANNRVALSKPVYLISRSRGVFFEAFFHCVCTCLQKDLVALQGRNKCSSLHVPRIDGTWGLGSLQGHGASAEPSPDHVPSMTQDMSCEKDVPIKKGVWVLGHKVPGGLFF